MKRLSLHFSTAVTAALLASGCAGSGDRYPSLAVRDAERFQGQFAVSAPDESARSAPIAPLASSRDVAQLVDRASDSHRAFIDAERGVARSVQGARGARVESETYTSALIALADLTSLRAETAIALGDLDGLAADSAVTFAPDEEVVAARALVLDLVSEQDRALADLWEELRR
ncbi:MAG: hypothetical protein AAF250_15455 [Pseudomonadota bacterium]